MARKDDGACANPKQIRTDVDCRAARPKFDSGAWSPAKISDVTGGGLYLFVTPDENRPGNAASKLWRMGYRFHSRQKTYSIGPYGNGKDGTFSLADARRERDKAKDLLKDGKDPSTEKQLVKHRQAAARPVEQWADEWLAKKKVEKVKRGRIVAVRDPKTIEVLELRVGYVKARFGKLCRQDIKRPEVLAFMRSYEADGKLETRDRVRSIGEQICDYADVEGDGYNPFRNLNGQMIANISTPRPGVTEPRDVTRVFRLISAPWTRARFSDVVGLALRFDALTIPRPGMVNEMEWSEVDWDADCSSRQNEDRLGPCRAFVTAGTRNPAQRSETDRTSPVRVFLLEGRTAIEQHAQQALAAAWHRHQDRSLCPRIPDHLLDPVSPRRDQGREGMGWRRRRAAARASR